MYQCEELVSACVNHLKDNISEANSAEVFAAARLVDSKALKEEIFTRMFHSDEPSEVVGSDEMVAHQDCKDLMGVWQNMHKVSCMNYEELISVFKEKERHVEQKIKKLTETNTSLQDKLNKRADCGRCRRCPNCPPIDNGGCC